MFSRYKNSCCPYKGLLHAKPSASVNTAVYIGGVCATDKLRRVELYREEVSNKQLYICILSDVSCRCTDNRKSVKHFSSIRPKNTFSNIRYVAAAKSRKERKRRIRTTFFNTLHWLLN